MKKFKITLESHSHTMKEISEDYNITDGIYEVEVSDPENGSEIYQAVKKKYHNLPRKEWNFITHYFQRDGEVEKI